MQPFSPPPLSKKKESGSEWKNVCKCEYSGNKKILNNLKNIQKFRKI